MNNFPDIGDKRIKNDRVQILDEIHYQGKVLRLVWEDFEQYILRSRWTKLPTGEYTTLLALVDDEFPDRETQLITV